DAALEKGCGQADPAHEVVVREGVELGVGQPPLGVEEAEVDGARAQAVEVVEETVAVLGADGADVDRAAVLQHLVGGIVAGDGRHGLRRTNGTVRLLRATGGRRLTPRRAPGPGGPSG